LLAENGHYARLYHAQKLGAFEPESEAVMA